MKTALVTTSVDHRSNAADRGKRGFALILALSVMLVVTLSLGLLERGLQRSLEAGRHVSGKIQADYACFGGATRAAIDPPDSVTGYDYYGTHVEVTIDDPPLSLMEIMIDKNSGVEGTLRLLNAVAASPTEDSSAESSWYYLVLETDRPRIWTSWPGPLRKQSEENE